MSVAIRHTALLVSQILLISFGVLAQLPVIKIDQKLVSKNISQDFYIYNEANNAPETLSDVLKRPNSFVPTNTKVAAFFASDAGHWLRFMLESDQSSAFILDFGALSFDELDVYLIDSAGKTTNFPHLSWKVLPENRPLKNEYFGYKLKLTEGKPVTIFVRGKNPKGTFRMPLRISTEAGFMSITYETERFYGIFFGVALFILAIGISFFFLSKDVSYLYYVLSVLFLVIQSAGLNSYFSSFLLKNAYWAADPTHANFFIPYYAFFHIAFLRNLLLDKTKTPKSIFKISYFCGFWALVVSGFMLLCLINTRVYFYMAYLVYVLYFSLIVNVVLNLIQGFKHNRSNAYFILISNTPFFLYLLFLILTNLRIVKQYSPYNIVMWCLLFDNIILCIGLAFRFNFISQSEVRLQVEINEQQNRTFEAEKKHQQEQLQRLEAQYKLQLEKERISRDLHDNIGSQLAYITSNIDYFSGKMAEMPDIQLKMESLGDHVRFTTQQLRDTIWAINKENILLTDFIKRVRNYVAKQVENNDEMIFELNKDEKLSFIVLSSSQALNLFRVIQEAINNIQKHSQATKITIDVFLKNAKINFKIIDNGKGFSLSQKKTESYGIENMQNRIAEMDGKFLLKSKPNIGTEINISVGALKIT